MVEFLVVRITFWVVLVSVFGPMMIILDLSHSSFGCDEQKCGV